MKENKPALQLLLLPKPQENNWERYWDRTVLAAGLRGASASPLRSGVNLVLKQQENIKNQVQELGSRFAVSLRPASISYVQIKQNHTLLTAHSKIPGEVHIQTPYAWAPLLPAKATPHTLSTAPHWGTIPAYRSAVTPISDLASHAHLRDVSNITSKVVSICPQAALPS